jgi:hypothetical protein
MTLIHRPKEFSDEQHNEIDRLMNLAKIEYPDIDEALLMYQVKGYVLNKQMYIDHYENKTVILPKKRDTEEEYLKYCKYDDETLKEYIKQVDSELHAN